MSLTLYYHPLSSFCHKVLIALYEHGVEFEPHTVNLGDASEERSRIATAYGMIDRQLASRTWVAGQGFSMADCAAIPALFYAHTLVPFPDGRDHLKAYFERLMERPSVRRVIEEAKPFFSFYPFADAIPERFR